MTINISELNTAAIQIPVHLSDDQLSGITGGKRRGANRGGRNNKPKSNVTWIAPVVFGNPQIPQPSPSPDINDLLDPSKLPIQF